MKYTSDIKEIKEFGFAKSVLYNIVLALFITLALCVASIWIFGLRLDIVLSDSMSPEFYKHDIVVIKPCDDYKVGDIIEFQMGVSKPVTHRVQSKQGTGSTAVYITKGDANSNEDAAEVKAGDINGKVIAVIDGGEHIYQFIKSNYFLFIDIILGVWVLSSTLGGEIEMRKHNIAKAE